MQDNKKATISAFIVCFNEEDAIERCLESVKWCDEIIVVDSFSTDKTLEICKKYTDKIFQRTWPGFKLQKQFGLDHCTSKWVLNLDADEAVSDELRDEILEKINDPKTDSKNINGFELLRVVNYMNKWWRKGGWYPEYRLRLVKREETVWGGDEPHEHAIIKSGKIEKLTKELKHYTYGDITHHIQTLNKFSNISAEVLKKKGKRVKFYNIIFNPIFRFIKFYILKKGFLEGFSGFVVAVIESYYVFLKYIKLWEKDGYSFKRDNDNKKTISN